jgi:mycofactocin precursor peptide peptidase
MKLADMTWPEIIDRPMVLVPVGSTEQHGPHLPLDTDTVIAEAVCARAINWLDDRRVLIAPPITFGSSGEHQSFPGTVSIGNRALRLFIIELVRSLHAWAGLVVLVNAHGGNAVALSSAVLQLRDEGHNVLWTSCVAKSRDSHAGRTETSLLLHLSHDRVRLDLAEAGNSEPLERILPLLIEHGVEALSTNGVLGDPHNATRIEGEEILDEMALQVALQIQIMTHDPSYQ